MDGTRREWSFSLIDRSCKIPISKIRIGKKMANTFFLFRCRLDQHIGLAVAQGGYSQQ